MVSKGFEIKIDTEQWVLRLENKVLYKSCAVDMKRAGMDIVTTLGKVMHSVFVEKEYKNSIETVFIEGHTDQVDPGPKCPYRTNWELSTQRAINTWEIMKLGEPRLIKLRNTNKERIFSVSGYGETRLLTKIYDEKAINRRIDIRIAMIPPSVNNKPELIRELEKKFSE